MKPRLPSRLIIFSLIVTILVGGWLYRDSFNAYFFQDDWFTLQISNAKSISDFFYFFIPRTDVIYYRPLGMQIPFFVIRRIFGINPLPFHILTFLTHAVNVILVFLLVQLLVKRDDSALLSSFFYATSSVHYTPFFWSSTYAFVLGPTAYFLSSILFLLFLKEKKKNYYLASLAIFIFGLLTNEMLAVLPIILLLYSFIFKKRVSLVSFLPYIFLVIMLYIARFVMFKPPTFGPYQLGVGRHLFTNIKTYFLWSYNWSEIATEQMVHLFIFNSKFLKEFPNYVFVSLSTFFISILLFYVFPLVIIIYKKNKEFWRLAIFGITWFIIGLSPVLFFPAHKFSYYLPISLVGLLFISTYLFGEFVRIFYQRTRSFSSVLSVILLVNWLFVSATTIDFNTEIHWVSRRAKLSRGLVGKAKKSYKGESFIYVLPSSENKLSLNDQDGLRVVFNNEDIVTVYTSEAKEEKVL